MPRIYSSRRQKIQECRASVAEEPGVGVLEEGVEESAVLSGGGKCTNRLQYNDHARLSLANATERVSSVTRDLDILDHVYTLPDLSERGREDGVANRQATKHAHKSLDCLFSSSCHRAVIFVRL